MNGYENTQIIDPLLCEHEPIHIPNAIQPHGAMLAALADNLLVTHASANLINILGRPAEAALGRPLDYSLGEIACRALLGDGLRDRAAHNHRFALAHADGDTLHLHAHWSDQHVCIDIEPLSSVVEEVPAISKLQSVLETFKQAATSDELCKLAVHGLRVITGYDRVMAYRFHPDGHGEVIAEACDFHLESYLGLHYPAADVPSQARRQYLRQRVGAIADSSYTPVPLLADSKLVDGKPLDLTHSTLRSVSPIHCEYMRNMKTAASLTVGLAKGQHLWGMLVCHHATSRIPRPEIRAVADMIGQVVSLMLGSLGEAEMYAQRLKRNETLRVLAAHLDAPVPLPAAFAAAQAELLLLVDAAGALIRLSGTVFSIGQTPGPAAVADALAVLEAEADGKPLANWLRVSKVRETGCNPLRVLGFLLMHRIGGQADFLMVRVAKVGVGDCIFS